MSQVVEDMCQAGNFPSSETTPEKREYFHKKSVAIVSDSRYLESESASAPLADNVGTSEADDDQQMFLAEVPSIKVPWIAMGKQLSSPFFCIGQSSNVLVFFFLSQRYC